MGMYLLFSRELLITYPALRSNSSAKSGVIAVTTMILTIICRVGCCFGDPRWSIWQHRLMVSHEQSISFARASCVYGTTLLGSLACSSLYIFIKSRILATVRPKLVSLLLSLLAVNRTPIAEGYYAEQKIKHNVHLPIWCC